jgi:flagellar export protein FliJ
VKKFEFPLQQAAKWYHQKLAAEQLTLQRWLVDLTSIEQRLRELQGQVTESHAGMQNAASVTGHELQTLARFVQHLGLERERLQPTRSHLLKKVEEQRQRVVAFDRKIKMIENLERRRRSEWLMELSKEEEALASDLFLAKLVRETQDTTLRR